jgi:hypothetical protein
MKKLILSLLLAGSMSFLSAGIIFTHEAPGVQATTVAGATTETFDALALGALGTYVSPIGTYSTGGQIVAPDQYGGSYQTQYISVGAQSGTTSYDLALTSTAFYFGFYWPAGDAQNHVDFYQGATLLASFDVGTISAGLSAAYYGNPNTGQNTAEPYVYLDFTSTDLGSGFDKIVFRNDSTGSGFETDNHSVFNELIPPPGVPEPSTWLLVSSSLAIVGLLKRRIRRG